MNTKRRSKQPDIPAWEWGVAGLGLVIFLGLIGFFIVRTFADQHPPDFQLQIDSVRAGAVSFTVRNRGDVTAAEVTIGTVDDPAAPTVRFDFVPGHSQRSGVLFLAVAPSVDPRLRVHSYLVP